MRFQYGKQELTSLSRGQGHHTLLTNGLGGYASVSAVFSVARCDQGILIAAERAPDIRVNLVHRLREKLRLGETETCLSSQSFADGTEPEEGFLNLSSFQQDFTPLWRYDYNGVRVERQLCLDWEKNTAAVLYTVENNASVPCALEVVPMFQFSPKGTALDSRDLPPVYTPGKVTSGSRVCYVKTDARLEKRPVQWECLSYPHDCRDGRSDQGLASSCCAVTKLVKPGHTDRFEILFSMEPEEDASGWALLEAAKARGQRLAEESGFADPVAMQLAVAADAFISRRETTGGKTILAGYPLFADWGRDTMIALPGCCLATGRYEDAKSILKTFLAYEKGGLVPNLFPEGGREPMYNTADAALLLIDCVWQYLQRREDPEFLREAYPVLERIVSSYRYGTRHGIWMDSDYLIRAGEGLDQVTWMDVCIDGILPTPRHGKPVEINAYWYNALMVMDGLSRMLGLSGQGYAAMAKKVKKSFREKFIRPDGLGLKDVLCGEKAEDQIRCNQIWAASITFSPLNRVQIRAVVETVYRRLYTGTGLRSLDKEDPEYHGYYGGPQIQRDMAYHQGTVWIFPMGGFYLAWLKAQGNTPEAAAWVRKGLEQLIPMLKEGCVGQLPEIYDGDFQDESKGCFAQAWSVAEMLRVYEAVEAIENSVKE